MRRDHHRQARLNRRAREARVSALGMLVCAALLLAPIGPLWLIGQGVLALVFAAFALVIIVGAIGGFYEAHLAERGMDHHPSMRGGHS